jgi:hypothetical protein
LEPEPIDPRRLRGILAEQQITYSAYARACKLSRVYVGLILGGKAIPGELAVIKMRRGLAIFGLSEESEVTRVAS